MDKGCDYTIYTISRLRLLLPNTNLKCKGCINILLVSISFIIAGWRCSICSSCSVLLTGHHHQHIMIRDAYHSKQLLFIFTFNIFDLFLSFLDFLKLMNFIEVPLYKYHEKANSLCVLLKSYHLLFSRNF